MTLFSSAAYISVKTPSCSVNSLFCDTFWLPTLFRDAPPFSRKHSFCGHARLLLANASEDIPEKADWSNAVRGKFYRPLKESLTIRIDVDVLAWFKAQGKGYQTRINAVLRKAVAGQIRRVRANGPRSRKY